MAEAQKNLKTMQGKVLSNKMEKTVTVLVERRVKHPVVGKVIKLSSKFHAHDEKNSIGEGDLVEIAESKPMSKTKTWVVTKVLSKAPQIN
jgi:small subunit ribosomal protein S17